MPNAEVIDYNGDPANFPNGEVNTITSGPIRSYRLFLSNSTQPIMNIQGKRPRMDMSISFSNNDLGNIQFPHEDALIIQAKISGFKIGKVMISTRSSKDIMYNHTFE